MIELYHCADARSFRALWALEELGLRYELHVLPFPPRFRQPEYLEANPLGTIPLLVDGDTRMTESAAIVQYLAVRYGPTDLAVAPDAAEYGAWLNWLHFGEATLTFPQTLVLRYRVLEPEERRLPQAADDYAQWFHSRLRHVERALADREWLVGGRFTMADISVGYALLLAKDLKIDNGFKPAVAAYWERLQARDGFARAKAAQKA
ncbi:glutathione S-transferase family protein [Sphingomonas radiodurans]|uniref:glutathione S-transferase family protein n=1 Tax=Sphingomonas radiodurans TaxID=2890321 RepID=UPI001E6374A5|nr:glutathione S-transferase family protein [Sphingomonas radiodurans]WBH16055.1 glutathione S-transferase family protein [Sphingomonas radiodurans]